MLGTCVAFLIALAGTQHPDRALTVAVIAFGAAIPFLLVDYYVALYRVKPGVAEFQVNLLQFTSFAIYEQLGAVCLVVGVVAVLGHVSSTAVMAFFAACGVVFFVAPALVQLVFILWLLVLARRKAHAEGRTLQALSEDDVKEVVRNSQFLSLFRPSWAKLPEQQQDTGTGS
jgi:hypothetical protein